MTVLYTRGRVRAALLALGLAAALCTTGCATVLTTVTSAALCSSTGQSRGCMGDVPRTGLAIDGAVLEHALRSGPRTTRAVEVRRFVCDGALHTAPSRIEARTRCVGALEARGIEAGLLFLLCLYRHKQYINHCSQNDYS